LKRSLFHFSRSRRGFTLIELLLAIAIAVIALSIVNATFFQSHRTIESVRGQSETYQMVRIVMDRIIKDLSCTYVPSTDKEMSDDEISMYRFVGENDTNIEEDNDSIYFTTTADLGLPSVSGGICEAGYYLKEMDESQGRYYLIRGEDCTLHPGVSDNPREMELAENVLGMNIVYIGKDDQEVDEWNLEDKLVLPSRIRITITFAGREEPFEMTGVVSLPLSSIQLKKMPGQVP